jgi:hypothetical protein
MNSVAIIKNSIDSILAAMTRSKGLVIDGFTQKERAIKAIGEYIDKNGDSHAVALPIGARAFLHPIRLMENQTVYDQPTFGTVPVEHAYFEKPFNPKDPQTGLVADGKLISCYVWNGVDFYATFLPEEGSPTTSEINTVAA